MTTNNPADSDCEQSTTTANRFWIVADFGFTEILQ